MPLYEYKCRKCHSVLEALQKVSDLPLKKCPKCGGPLFKLLSPPSIQFKGSGFYITDYAQKKQPEKETKADKKLKVVKKEASQDKDGSSSTKSVK